MGAVKLQVACTVYRLFQMVLNGIAVTVGVQCRQEEKCNDNPKVSWVIKNCVQMVVTLTASDNVFDARTVDKDGLFLEVHTSKEDQVSIFKICKNSNSNNTERLA